jgi:hypothetical protein
MKFILPATIGDVELISSDVPEDDHDEWDVATSYGIGDLVISSVTHRIYESIAGSNVGNNPATSPLQWLDLAPTNRWAMFDNAVGTLTTQAEQVQVTLFPGPINSIAILDIDADEVLVEMYDGASLLYSRTILLTPGDTVLSWYDYFFDPITRQRTVFLDDLVVNSNATITITITGTADVSVGTLVVGKLIDVGDTQYGFSLGIIDYSKRVTNDFGVTSVTKRGYAKRLNARVKLPSAAVDEVSRRLSAVRATPVIWIGAPGYDESVIYGFYKDWSIDVAHWNVSFCQLTIEGLV